MKLNIVEIMNATKHRYPFLLVDKVLEVESSQYCKAVKNVTMNEMHFMGHFPECPIMPGVLLIETAAQTVAIASSFDEQEQEKDNEIPALLKVDEVKFYSPVIPGDVLIIEVENIRKHKFISLYKFKITCEGKMVCSGQLTFGRVSKDKIYN